MHALFGEITTGKEDDAMFRGSGENGGHAVKESVSIFETKLRMKRTSERSSRWCPNCQ